jgi:23S rRNA (cytosine1962-C5)-methyltransferase
MKQEPTILTCAPSNGYALLDSGEGRKLERYGKVIVDRPEPQALWTKRNGGLWAKADAVFSNASEKEDDDKGSWKTLRPNLPETFPVKVEDVTMQCQLMSFRHMGLFPEQLPHWIWMRDLIQNAGRPLKILNLFAYTGAASLIAAKAGAEVTHLDASKKAISWAKDNQSASQLDAAPLRWICDDAGAFVARELRRGRTYDGILLDPPKYGRGPDGETWRFETDIGPLLQNCAKLLSDNAAFMVVTAYALRFSSLALGHLLNDAMGDRPGSRDHGELWIEDENRQRPMPTSLFARWQA